MSQIQPSPTDLATLFDAARSFAHEAVPENTRRAYRADWEHFSAWCASTGRSTLPATTETVVLYVSFLAASHRITTIRRKVAAISTAHQLARQETPTRHASLRLCLRGIARSQAEECRSREPVAPLLLEDLVAMIRATPDTLAGKRDRALLLLGFAGGFRRSELVALDVKDLQWTKEGVLVRMRRSKTDQTGEAAEKAIPYAQVRARCPVHHLKEWLETGEITGGAVFRRIRKGDKLLETRLTPQSVALIIKQYAAAVGLDESKLSGHSLRAGFVTVALINGASYPEIQRQTGHRSLATVTRYNRDRVQFRNNAVYKLGM